MSLDSTYYFFNVIKFYNNLLNEEQTRSDALKGCHKD